MRKSPSRSRPQPVSARPALYPWRRCRTTLRSASAPRSGSPRIPIRSRPTPTTAWAVTALGACAGVMVTASHNPPAYNGYKVYWGNGAQIIPPHDNGIAAEVAKIGRSDQLAMPALDELRARGLVVDLTE